MIYLGKRIWAIASIFCAFGILSGCLAPSNNQRAGQIDLDATGAARSFFTTALSKAHLGPTGDVVLRSGGGYCIDARGIFHKDGTELAVLASCYNLTNTNAGGFVPPAVILVAIEPANLARPRETALEIRKVSGAPALGETRPYWRAVGRKGHRLIGLSLAAPPISAAKGQQGKAALKTIFDRIEVKIPKQVADKVKLARVDINPPKSRPKSLLVSGVQAKAAPSGQSYDAPPARPEL